MRVANARQPCNDPIIAHVTFCSESFFHDDAFIRGAIKLSDLGKKYWHGKTLLFIP